MPVKAIRVKVKLPRIDKIRKDFGERAFARTLYQSGTWLQARILKNWNSAKGANGTKFKKLTSRYKARKVKGIKVDGTKRTGEPIPNLALTGDLQRSMYVDRRSRRTVALTFREKEKRKAEGNAENRPNMMRVSRKMAQDVRDFFFRRIIKKTGI